MTRFLVCSFAETTSIENRSPTYNDYYINKELMSYNIIVSLVSKGFVIAQQLIKINNDIVVLYVRMRDTEYLNSGSGRG